MPYADVFSPKKSNPSGTKLLLSFAPISTFATISEPTSPGSNLGDGVKITADHTFATGGRFYKLELETNKNDLQGEYSGEARGNHQKQTFTGFASGLSEEQADLLRQAKNEKHIVMVHLKDGRVKQLGVENDGATIKYGSQTGNDDGGDRGMNITVEAYHDDLFYEGAISYTEAT